ncbi:hypothetical protein SAMN05216215_100141 [Saccharopolyspora shandongensis]|uniref:Uncharacterized protein n=1 Tax=Saccharopolyspora shandongensis TaxID=418495 RepID=A0A1H2QBI2_9PSEU|nr:hypothetical protein [Saccharopolyspora shandongensis]SDW04034.1 hypothetical protein SAMN05216215_100141 [Saccharopolyspora shandongensis]
MNCTEVDELLRELRRRGGVFYAFGPKDDPEVVVHAHLWPTCADVVILRGEDDATAYRTPTMPGADVFAPVLVSWQYHAPAAWTLRAVLTLPTPGDVHAPISVLKPDPLCFLALDLRRPVTIRSTPHTEPPLPRRADDVERLLPTSEPSYPPTIRAR